MLTPITVRDVMNAPVETIDSDESCRVAADRLVSAGIGSLVVRENGDSVGIVTEVDVARLVSSGREPTETPVSAFMSSPLITIGVERPIEEAAETLREHDIKRLPVVDDDDDVVGIVTTTDLSSYLPHVIRRGRQQSPETDRQRRSVRVDTAYENEGWEYEYLGDESGVSVGDTSTFAKTLTEADVEAFAEASGDTNRLHLDGEYAAETRFGERIAHGTLVSGIISAALARIPGLVIYLSQDVGYLGPVPLETRVTAECEVVEQMGENRFRLTTVVRRADGEKVIDGEAMVISDTIPDT
ncbi:MAG: CBS domain-containing protein [Halovenus sp.]